MAEYTQGVCQDGAAILEDGIPLSIEDILERLRENAQLRSDLQDAIVDIEAGNEYVELCGRLQRELGPFIGHGDTVDYHSVMWAEMSPDVYDGPECDEVRPRWHAFAEGDMDSDYTEEFSLLAKHFPPGTKVSVQQPCCPECGQIAELCSTDDMCEFDWNEWTLSRFS